MTDESDLYYMRARYYNPVAKRFLSPDTLTGQITNPQSQNLYVYCQGNPVMYVDPTGYNPIIEKVIVIIEEQGPKVVPYVQIAGRYAATAGRWSLDKTIKAGQWIGQNATEAASWVAEKVAVTVKGAGKASRSLLNVSSKANALKAIDNLPQSVQGSVKSFIKGSSNKYTDYSVEQMSNGSYLVRMTKPGDVPGSKAIYYKEISPNGTTVRVYKETYDPLGNLIHVKDK